MKLLNVYAGKLDRIAPCANSTNRHIRPFATLHFKYHFFFRMQGEGIGKDTHTNKWTSHPIGSTSQENGLVKIVSFSMSASFTNCLISSLHLWPCMPCMLMKGPEQSSSCLLICQMMRSSFYCFCFLTTSTILCLSMVTFSTKICFRASKQARSFFE